MEIFSYIDFTDAQNELNTLRDLQEIRQLTDSEIERYGELKQAIDDFNTKISNFA